MKGGEREREGTQNGGRCPGERCCVSKAVLVVIKGAVAVALLALSCVVPSFFPSRLPSPDLRIEAALDALPMIALSKRGAD